MRTAPGLSSAASGPLKWLLVVGLAAHVFFPLLWLVRLVQHGPLENDWWHFRVAAGQFVAGDWAALYSLNMASGHSGYFWRHPPFMLYAVAPLAWLPPSAAYGAVAAAGSAALLAAIGRLSRLVPIVWRAPWALAIVLSAPALTTLITGQLSGILLLIVASGALLWTQGRPVAACAVLGLLAIKPNVGIFFGLYAIVRGEWRGVIAMCGVVLALCATTIPLGPGLWRDFLGASLANADVLGQYDPYKLITVQGFMSGAFGPGPLVSAAWAAIAAGLLAAAIWSWRRSASRAEDLATTVLLAVAANPYLSFYDALLLAFPATVWLSERPQWRRGPWLIVGGLIGMAWVWEHFAHSWVQVFSAMGWPVVAPFSLVGPVSAAWLVVSMWKGRDARPGP